MGHPPKWDRGCRGLPRENSGGCVFARTTKRQDGDGAFDTLGLIR